VIEPQGRKAVVAAAHRELLVDAFARARGTAGKVH
jgi:hypothetical protein